VYIKRKYGLTLKCAWHSNTVGHSTYNKLDIVINMLGQIGASCLEKRQATISQIYTKFCSVCMIIVFR
jgi:hypothetical protein